MGNLKYQYSLYFIKTSKEFKELIVNVCNLEGETVFSKFFIKMALDFFKDRYRLYYNQLCIALKETQIKGDLILEKIKKETSND